MPKYTLPALCMLLDDELKDLKNLREVPQPPAGSTFRSGPGGLSYLSTLTPARWR